MWPWHGLTTRRPRMWPANVDNIRQNHKPHQECLGHLDGGIDNGRPISKEVTIQRVIFQGDSLLLLLLLFVLASIPLKRIYVKCTGCERFSNSQEKINHLLYMEDIKHIFF